MVTDKDESKKGRYVVEEVPTQTAIVLKDTETEEVFNIESALVKILNVQDEILKQMK